MRLSLSTTSIFLAAALVGAAVPAGSADAAGQGAWRWFARHDLNRDGRITAEEARAVGTVRFLRLDADGDGVVTRREVRDATGWAMRPRAAAFIERRFASFDGNGDGRVERAEFETAARERFRRADRDGDGALSWDEVVAAHRALTAPRTDEDDDAR